MKNSVYLLNKDCLNLMELLKKQDKDNKPILYLGRNCKKVILSYEEFIKMSNRIITLEKEVNSNGEI